MDEFQKRELEYEFQRAELKRQLKADWLLAAILIAALVGAFGLAGRAEAQQNYVRCQHANGSVGIYPDGCPQGTTYLGEA